jgi:hypothetical protein
VLTLVLKLSSDYFKFGRNISGCISKDWCKIPTFHHYVQEIFLLFLEILKAEQVCSQDAGVDDDFTGNMVRGDLGHGENFSVGEINGPIRRCKELVQLF